MNQFGGRMKKRNHLGAKGFTLMENIIFYTAMVSVFFIIFFIAYKVSEKNAEKLLSEEFIISDEDLEMELERSISMNKTSSKYDLKRRCDNLQKNLELLRTSGKKFEENVGEEFRKIGVHISALEQIIFKLHDSIKQLNKADSIIIDEVKKIKNEKGL